MGCVYARCADASVRVAPSSRPPEQQTVQEPEPEEEAEEPADAPTGIQPSPSTIAPAPSFFNARQKPVLGHYRVIDNIATISLGLVSVVKDINTGNLFAAKVYQMKEIMSKQCETSNVDLYEDLRNEIEVMQTLQHPNCLELVEVVEDPVTESISLITPLARGSLMKDKAVCQLPEDEAQIVFQQVACGLHHIHESNIVHRDIKPDNVLWFTDRYVISDYSVSKFVTADNDICTDTRGAMRFLPPEAFLCEQHHGKPADVWAFGLTLYAVIYGQLPYPDIHIMHLSSTYQKNGVPYPEDVPISPELHDLFTKIFEIDPQLRYTMDEILQHPWMQVAAIYEEKEEENAL